MLSGVGLQARGDLPPGAVRMPIARAPVVADSNESTGPRLFIALFVPDLEATARWYSETLGLRRVMTIPRMGTIVGGAALEGDGIVVELLQREDAKPGTTPVELTHGSAKAGILVADFDRCQATPRSRPRQNGSRNAVLSTLPAPDSGSDSTNATLRGDL